MGLASLERIRSTPNAPCLPQWSARWTSRHADCSGHSGTDCASCTGCLTGFWPHTSSHAVFRETLAKPKLMFVETRWNCTPWHWPTTQRMPGRVLRDVGATATASECRSGQPCTISSRSIARQYHFGIDEALVLIPPARCNQPCHLCVVRRALGCVLMAKRSEMRRVARCFSSWPIV